MFSNKAICGECGCRLTRYQTGSNRYKKYVTWCCAHYKDGTECKTTGIVEEKVHSAFVKLFNTLYCNCDQILVPFSKAIMYLRAMNRSYQTRILQPFKQSLEEGHPFVAIQLRVKINMAASILFRGCYFAITVVQSFNALAGVLVRT